MNPPRDEEPGPQEEVAVPHFETLKVSSRSRPKSVAGALSTVVERDGKVILHAIGAGAVYQAVKAVAIARGYLLPKGPRSSMAMVYFSCRGWRTCMLRSRQPVPPRMR